MKIIQKVQKGRCVIAEMYYAPKTVICSNETITLAKKDVPFIKKTTLKDYYFDWYGICFIALGFASLFNHDANPNLDWKYNKKTKRIIFFAAKDIKAGDELTFDYGWTKYPWISKGK